MGEELTTVYLVTISHSEYNQISTPFLRWIVTGVQDNLAAIKVVMGSSANKISHKAYNTVNCVELKPSYDGTDVKAYSV